MVKMPFSHFCLSLWIYFCSTILVISSETKVELKNFEVERHDSENDVPSSHSRVLRQIENFQTGMGMGTGTGMGTGIGNNGNGKLFSSINKFFSGQSSITREFAYYLELLTFENNSEEISTIKNYLMYLIQTKFLRIKEIMEFLKKFTYLKEKDRAVMMIILLADSLPTYCHLKAELFNLISLNIKLKYLEEAVSCHRNPGYLKEEEQICSNNGYHLQSLMNSCNYFPVKQPGDIIDNIYKNTILENTVERKTPQLPPLPPPVVVIKTPPQPSTPPQLSVAITPTAVKTTKVITEVKKLIDLGKIKTLTVNVLKSLPPPPTPELEENFAAIKLFLETEKNTILLQKIATESPELDINPLRYIYELIKSESSIEMTLKAKLINYLEFALGIYIPKPKHNYLMLLDILPNPADATEKVFLESLEAAFKDYKSWKILSVIDFEHEVDLKKLLIQALQLLKAQYGTAQVVEAASYYLLYLEKLEKLTLVGTKKIEKRFDLTGILSDTLHLNTLPSNAKLSFRSFYKFLANLNQENMNNFTQWNDAKTKAEFMSFLFQFFLKESFVPEQVKESIKVLIPHIEHEGKAALPP